MTVDDTELLSKLMSEITLRRVMNLPLLEQHFKGLFLFESERNVDIAGLLCPLEFDQPDQSSETPGRKMFDEYVIFSLSQTRNLQKWWIRDLQKRQAMRAQPLKWWRRFKFF